MPGSYHLAGGAPLIHTYKLGATISNLNVPLINTATTGNITPASTTSGAAAVGVSVSTGTYSTTQGDAEGIVRVSCRPDLVICMLASGGATEGTALTLLSNTSASTDGLTITDADVGSADMDGGTVWCISGANVGQSRTITTHTGSTSFAVTVPFKNDIAVGDQFLFVPWNMTGDGAAGGDGNGHVQLTTNLYQADASIASGTGIEASVVELELEGRSNSYVYFKLRDHVFDADTI